MKKSYEDVLEALDKINQFYLQQCGESNKISPELQKEWSQARLNCKTQSGWTEEDFTVALLSSIREKYGT